MIDFNNIQGRNYLQFQILTDRNAKMHANDFLGIGISATPIGKFTSPAQHGSVAETSANFFCRT